MTKRLEYADYANFVKYLSILIVCNKLSRIKIRIPNLAISLICFLMNIIYNIHLKSFQHE
nr:hypothetical protein [Dinophyceae sp. MRD-151]